MVLCAHCGRSVAPDTDHVRVELEKKRMQDRNETEEYYLHVDCSWEVTEDWTEP
jgi:hypothetical protein